MSEEEESGTRSIKKSSSSDNPSNKITIAAAAAMDVGWTNMPGNALEKILIRLERDDVARSCVVCRRWNSILSSAAFQRSYRKLHRSNNAWTWLASCLEPDQDGSSSNSSPATFRLVAWNLHYRKCFKVMEIEPCPASKYHPKNCWLDFAATDGLLAWGCRHTLNSIRVGDPLHPSSIMCLPAAPPFPDNVVYEFRLGLAPEAASASESSSPGFKLVLLRLAWPHSEQQNAPVVLTASMFRSSTGQWDTHQVKVSSDLKRWGNSVVSKGVFYVVLRPPGKHGPALGLLSYNMNAVTEPWSHQEVMLPGQMQYDWQDRIDLIDRYGNLILVVYSYQAKSVTILQAEEMVHNRMTRAQIRWVVIGNMPAQLCRQFSDEIGSPWKYRCRGWSDYIFFTGPSGAGLVFSIPRRIWHRMDMSVLTELDAKKNCRYLSVFSA